MDFEKLQELINQRYITVQKHPTEELYIYNYTQSAQYERVWNEITLQCRGLIIDDKKNIIARPFPKFFNMGEHDPSEIPQEPFEVYEKMDGSLGILYWLADKPFIASRGSFYSEQAEKGSEMLYNKYKDTFSKLRRDVTYLFEIIYPENRIVVDYGNKQELVLIGMVDTHTGNNLPLEDIGFPLVPRYDGVNDLDKLSELQHNNKEGFVVKFKSGFRVKIKFDEYVRLHRILTSVSSRLVWEYLKDDKPFEDILERVPDEFFDWVRKTKEDFLQQYKTIEEISKKEYASAPILQNGLIKAKQLSHEERKEVANYFLSCTHQKILFAMLDERDYSEYIWKMLYPAFEKPFSQTEE